ncbi:mechanosensitive ion channel family protein [Pararhodonellum marinum]|uniref:mechanosensitive ion channel family protein n=1 Tax=Pararhodonellum marinum TaxID=2755358 RepID=UPI001E2ECC52|nr:mechanosensitive ion channel domain-containing protein [Pararhodonellum marinum]
MEFLASENIRTPTLMVNFLKATTFFLAGNILVSLGRIITVRFYLRKKNENIFQKNFVLGINHIANIINVGLFLISIMLLFNIDPVNFFTSITIVAAAIALLSKDYITNMINGLIIMFSDQFSLGDHIRIGDHKGKIVDVTLLNTVLVNEDDDLVMIPNTLFLTSQVSNHSRQDFKKLSFEFELKISGKFDLLGLEEKVKENLKPFDQHISMETFSLKTIAIQKDSFRLKIQFVLKSAEKEQEREIKRAVNQSLIFFARENQ